MISDGELQVLLDSPGFAVCVKPPGVISEDVPGGMPELLSHTLGGDFYTVHRLDKPVGGIMVYARTPSAASVLSSQLQSGKMKKCYKALCYGTPGSGEMDDLLFKDSKAGKAYIVGRMRKGVRRAKLVYSTEETFDLDGRDVSFVDIELITGRFHQIRAQFSSRGFPLLGDNRYGARDKCKGIALFAYRLVFTSPDSGQELTYEIPFSSTQFKYLW